jgi:hypothetical protein
MRIFAVAGIFLSLTVTQALADIVVGTANLNNCAPFGCSVGGNWDYFQIYSASSFSKSLTFDSITFFNTVHPGPILSGNYDIQFGVTTNPLGTTSAPALTSVASFFDGQLGGSVGDSFTIAGLPYFYDPASGNLVMHIVAAGQPHPFAGLSAQYLNADQGGPMSQFVSGDGFSAYSQNVGLSYRLSRRRP